MSQFRFRVESRDLHSFPPTQRHEIKRFQTFILKKPDGHCSFCMKMLYPEEQKYRKVRLPNELPCLDWNIQPKTKNIRGEQHYMVCTTHRKADETRIVRFSYPGL